MPYSDIESIRNHVFINEHDLGNGEHGRFASHWRIAQAWQRLEQEKGTSSDILLLEHERLELTLMTKYGYNTIQAHEIAEHTYSWDQTFKGEK